MELYNEIYAYESDKVTPFIYKTNDLSKFNNYEFNRDIDLGHVRILSNKIKDFTLCPLICTFDNNKIFILDGQHRLEVAKRLNVPIYYRLIDRLESLDIAALQVKRNWNPLNWVKYWACNNNPEYITLLKYYNEYKLSISTLSAMLTTPHINTDINEGRFIYKNISAKQINSGKFVVKNEPFAKMILTQLKDYPKVLRNNHRFIKALISVNMAYQTIDSIFAKYNHNQMKKIIERYPERFEKKTSIYDFMRMIEDNINIGASDKNKARFF